MNKKLKQQIVEALRVSVAAGFAEPKQIVTGLCDMFAGEAPRKDLRAEATKALPALIAEHEAERKSWPATTDCDRLDAAFEELNTMGIMARHNWTCCGTCGHAAMEVEFDRLRGKWKKKPIIGYAFYHAQHTEDAVRGEGISLLFASTVSGGGEAAYNARSCAVAKAVCGVLKAHRLKPKWEGDHNWGVELPMKWKRRQRPARFFEGDLSVK
jgi:hypothetical protein